MQPVRSQLEQAVLWAALQGGLAPGPAPLSIPKLLAEWDLGVSRYKPLYTGWVNNKVLL